MGKKILAISMILTLALTVACSNPSEPPPPEEESTQTNEIGTTEPSEPEEQPSEATTPETIEDIEPYDPIANNFMPYQEPLLQNENGKLMLTKEQVLEDYEYLWKMIEENVPYYSEIGGYLGKNLNMVKSKHQKQIEGISTDHITATEYIALLYNALAEFNGVGHLRIISDESFKNDIASNYQYHVDVERYPDLFQRLLDITRCDKTKSFYQNISNSMRSSQENNIDLSDDEKKTILSDFFEQNIFMSAESDVPHLVIKTFGAPEGLGVEYRDYATEKISDLLRHYFDSPNIIIDLRGNGGGTDGIWLNGIVPVLVSQEIKFYLSGGVNESDYHNFLLSDVSLDLPDDFPNLALQPERWEYILWGMSRWESPEQPEVYGGKVWLLVDEWVYSASEHFAAFCKQTEFATLVGTQTHGNGGTAIPAWIFALPNSGALVYYDATYAFNEDGTCNQLYGTKPDIDAGGRDALAVCLEEIAKLEN